MFGFGGHATHRSVSGPFGAGRHLGPAAAPAAEAPPAEDRLLEFWDEGELEEAAQQRRALEQARAPDGAASVAPTEDLDFDLTDSDDDTQTFAVQWHEPLGLVFDAGDSPRSASY